MDDESHLGLLRNRLTPYGRAVAGRRAETAVEYVEAQVSVGAPRDEAIGDILSAETDEDEAALFRRPIVGILDGSIPRYVVGEIEACDAR